jgi:hypothetical protein
VYVLCFICFFIRKSFSFDIRNSVNFTIDTDVLFQFLNGKAFKTFAFAGVKFRIISSVCRCPLAFSVLCECEAATDFNCTLSSDSIVFRYVLNENVLSKKEFRTKCIRDLETHVHVCLRQKTV